MNQSHSLKLGKDKADLKINSSQFQPKSTFQPNRRNL